MLLTLLLVAEATLGVLAGVYPDYVGVGLTNRLVDMLQRNFGVPGKEQLTAAVDLAQNKVSFMLILLYKVSCYS